MSEFLESKWPALVATVLIAWVGWLSVNVITLSQQMEGIRINQSNVIPPVVESSLRELRDKTNTQEVSDRELLTRLTETAINNAKDIGYLKEQMARKNP